jgi:hypothetical protein
MIGFKGENASFFPDPGGLMGAWPTGGILGQE